MPPTMEEIKIKLYLEGAGTKDDLFHLLSHDDLFYTFGDKEKQSNPIMILRKHAIHLFQGGDGDVSGAIKSKNYSVMLYCRDAKGRKLILKNTRLHGTIRDNLKSALMSCAKKEYQPPKKVVPTGVVKVKDTISADTNDWTLWIEAKVVPKKVQKEVDDDNDEKEESSTVVEDDRGDDASDALKISRDDWVDGM